MSGTWRVLSGSCHKSASLAAPCWEWVCEWARTGRLPGQCDAWSSGFSMLSGAVDMRQCFQVPPTSHPLPSLILKTNAGLRTRSTLDPKLYLVKCPRHWWGQHCGGGTRATTKEGCPLKSAPIPAYKEGVIKKRNLQGLLCLLYHLLPC